jgi:hypothetical protein
MEKIILTQCRDLSCQYQNHLMCPMTICYELLHANYSHLKKLNRCKNISCLDPNHVKCPTCGTTLHYDK